jgi:hypothetical protein
MVPSIHCAWCPQSSSKIEKTNELLKDHLTQFIQETYSTWTKLLPITLLRFRNTPGKQVLTPFEYLYDRPFLTNDFLLKLETAQLVSHVILLAKFQQSKSEIKHSIPRQHIQDPPLFFPRRLNSDKILRLNSGLKHSSLVGSLPSSSMYPHGSANS